MGGGEKRRPTHYDPSWAKLVHKSAAMDTVEVPIPRDLRREESLTCTFVILGGTTPHARPRIRPHLQPGISAQI
jgi:hypothetical protein